MIHYLSLLVILTLEPLFCIGMTFMSIWWELQSGALNSEEKLGASSIEKRQWSRRAFKRVASVTMFLKLKLEQMFKISGL